MYLIEEIIKNVCFEIQIHGNLPHTYYVHNLEYVIERVAGEALMISKKFSNLEK